MYKQQIIAFVLFASTKAGKAYLLSHEEKGFNLTGVFIKDLNISADSDVIDHTVGVDVDFETRELNEAEGLADHKLTNNNKRLSLTFVLDGD